MISYSTFYNFTSSCTIAAGLIYKTYTHECTDRLFFFLIRRLKNGEKQPGVYKMYPLVSQWKRGICTSDTMGWLFANIGQKPVCYVKVKDRYTLTICPQLSIYRPQSTISLISNYWLSLQLCQKILFRLIKCSLSPTSGFLGPSNSSI